MTGAPTVCQRWNGGRQRWTPSLEGERFDARRYEVLPIPDDTTAAAYITANTTAVRMWRRCTGSASTTGAGEDPKAWLRAARDDAHVTLFRHPGVLRYVLTLGANARARKAVKVALPALPYPKTRAARELTTLQ